MDFSLTDEQQHLRRTVREFAEAEIAPHVMEWDEASQFPSEIIPKLAEMGFLGVIFPEKYGGAGIGYIEYAIIIEELSRVDGSVGIIVAAHNSLCTNHIYKFGTEEQRQKYVVPLAQGKKLGCWSLTEPEAGSDAGGTRTTAAKKATAGCSTARRPSPPTGTTPMSASAWPSRTPRRSTTASRRSSSRRELRDFVRARKKTSSACAPATPAKWSSPIAACPRENLLGSEGEGFVNSLQILDGGRISIAALGLGMAQGAYECSVRYAKQRKQFGKPISEFQAIQFKLADMATQIEAARLLTYRAAWLADRAMPKAQETSLASPANPAWPSFTRAKSLCAWPTKPSRFTAATASSRIIRSKSIIAT